MKSSFLLVSFLGCLAVCHADAVRLQVVGPDGKPVAGAKVHVVESSAVRARIQSNATRDLTSNASGSIAFESKQPLLSATNKGGETVSARVVVPHLVLKVAALKAGDNTLALQKAQIFGGVALNADQQPVAGAKIGLSTFTSSASSLNSTDAFPFASLGSSELATVTDKDGKWNFDFLPSRGTAYLEMGDARVAPDTFELDLSQPAPPLFLERAATIKGRMLRPDGTPAPGVRFYADFRFPQVTDKDGRFEVSGLGTQDFDLWGSNAQDLAPGIPSTQKLPFLVPSKAVRGLKAGETRDIGDWKTRRGLPVRARVVDSATSKPIAGATVSLWGADNGDGRSDKSGAVGFLIGSDAASQMTVSAPGYIALQRAAVPDSQHGTISLGTLELKRGQTRRGKVVDLDGQPLGDRDLTLVKQRGSFGSEQLVRVAADGTFVLNGLDVGDFSFRAGGQKIASGAKFSVAKNTANAPLRVVLASHAQSGKTSMTGRIEGRVLDAGGAPVAGAKITFTASAQNGLSSSEPEALSQSDGSFHGQFYDPASRLSVTSVVRPGYVLAKSEVSLENGAVRVAITLQPSGLSLRGRVVDARGKGIAGAFVGLRDGDELPVSTGENGEFALKDAPLSGVALLASNGASLSSFQVQQAGGAIEIALPDAAPERDKTALADELLPRSDWSDRPFSEWEEMGLPRMEILAAPEKAGDTTWLYFLDILARREPETFRARGEELRRRTSPNSQAGFERISMLARASSPDSKERAKVEDYLRREKSQKIGLSVESVTHLLQLSEIAARLDAKEGAAWLEFAAQVAEQLPENHAINAWNWGTLAGRISPDAAQKLGENWSPLPQMMLLQTAMASDIERGDLPSARAKWNKVASLSQDAKNQPPDKDGPHREYAPKTGQIEQTTRAQYAQFLAQSDPQAAFTLARELSLDGSEWLETMPVIGQSAANQKQFDLARQALRATFDSRVSNSQNRVKAATIAATFDTALSDELWARLAPATKSKRTPASIAAFAQARAGKSPGQSRILIERRWPSLLKEQAARAGNGYDTEDTRMSYLVGEMARLSSTRALEMVAQLPTEGTARGKAIREIVRALLQND